MATLMVTKTLISPNPKTLSLCLNHPSLPLSSSLVCFPLNEMAANPITSSLRRYHLSALPRTTDNLSPNLVSFPLTNPSLNQFLTKKLVVSSSLTTNPPVITSNSSGSSPSTFFTDSTRTISTIAALAFAVSTVVVNSLRKVSCQVLNSDTVCALGPLFMASSIKNRPSGYLNTPLTVVAAGLSKWLDIYSGVLMVRVLLSWFPNVPWDRQPLSAIRDLCDPYLNLFRNIIPPIFDTLDVSPLLAFAVLGVLGSILTNSRGVY